MKNYLTNTYHYNDIEQIVHENIISHNEDKIYVSCKINDNIERKVYENEHNLSEVLHFNLDGATLYVDVAGKMICNGRDR